MPLAAVGQELHRVEQFWLLLHFIEDHEAGAVVKPAYRIRSQPDPLVGIVEGNIDRRGFFSSREEIPHQGGLSRLTRPRHDGNRRALQTAAQERQNRTGVQQHRDLILALSLQIFK